MQITQQMFESYLRCPYKCFLHRAASTGQSCEFTEWQRHVQRTYEDSAWNRLRTFLASDTVHCGNPPLTDIQSQRYKLIGQYEVTTPQIQSRLNAIQLNDIGAAKSRRAMYLPLRFIVREKLSDRDRLCLAFDALALSSERGDRGDAPHVGKIVHGEDFRLVTINLDAPLVKARKIISRIRQHDNQNSLPPLILNRNCIECEFQSQCRAIAAEHDDLSLLAKFSEKEWKRQHEKGIFTVTQLSYTFRPRKRLTSLSLQHHHALKALAIRTKKIHVFGSVVIPETPAVPVFLDVEGDPDRGFYYLIGLRVCRGGADIQHSFWADTPSDEEKLWSDFLDVLTSIKGARIFHYGSYETAFLKRMGQKYPKYTTPFLDALRKSAVNVLSIIHEHVFFPTYSNSLKDIAAFLGFSWSESTASGLSALVWRSYFESSLDPAWKAKLVRYNAEDCEALEGVVERLCALAARATAEQGDVVDAGTIKREYPHRFGNAEFVLPQFKAINEAAYWDHQRNRVYIRTLPKKAKSHHDREFCKNKIHPNKVVALDESRPRRCPQCAWKVIYKWGTLSQTVYDLRLSGASVKRWVVRFVFHRFICWKCKKPFQLYVLKPKYGAVLIAYVLYQLFEMYLPQSVIGRGLERLFGLPFSRGGVNHLKANAAEKYRPSYDRIVQRLISGSLIQADETKARINGQDSYVWVFTSLRDVAFVYRPTREANFLHDFIEGFEGVLVSDFYSGYDAIPCAQQKCLIHLMRDMNDDLRKYPFNSELKGVAEAFAELLRSIVATVDRFGLKKCHLQKHKAAAEKFLGMVKKSDFQTEIALAYRTRFEKNQNSLFTFLDHDGIPWNNNNAEHAIKAFARLRRTIGGSSTVKGIEDYLTLLSVTETCTARDIDVLSFFLSGTQDAMFG